MDDLRPVNYLSAASANAYISEMRQTTISPVVLLHINLLLDEVMSSLLEAAQSLNPKELRSSGVPAVFSSGGSGPESTGVRSFARECVAEAELEMRSWHELNPAHKGGFAPGGNGRGLTVSKENTNARFPHEEAMDLLRLRCSDLSPMSPSLSNYAELENAVLMAWKAAGGDTSEETLEPTVCWVNGLVEHICERILAQLSRVMERDSSVSVASPQDLYIALAEDECIYGWFTRLKVKASLQAATTSQKTGKRSVQRDPITGRSSPADSIVASPGESFGSQHKKSLSVADASRTSVDPSSRGAAVTRRPSTMSKRFGIHHDRKDSALSVSTRSIRGSASSDPPEDLLARSRSPREDEDDFDALVRSGQTMKVSLTPSRLKTFEGVQKRGPAPLSQYTQQPVVTHLPKQYAQPSDSSNLYNAEASSTESSTRKLIARGATVEELLDEDEKLQGPNQSLRNQSLRELLESEPAEFAASQPKARTVPAVILGSTPPRATSTSDSTSQENGTGTAQFSNRDPLAPRRARDDDEAPSKHKRTEAQELADFFNSAPLPPLENHEPVEKPASHKSGMRFKGFMSKVTGGGKKKDEEGRLARESAAWEIPTAQPRASQGFKHHRSMASLGTSNGAPPSSYRQASPFDDGVPAVPRTFRKRSDASEKGQLPGVGAAAAGAAAAGAAAGAAIHVTRETRKSNESVKPQTTPLSSLSSPSKPLYGVSPTVETGTARPVTPPPKPTLPVLAVAASPPRNESLRAMVEATPPAPLRKPSPDSSPIRRTPVPAIEEPVSPSEITSPQTTTVSLGDSSVTAVSIVECFATAPDEHKETDQETTKPIVDTREAVQAPSLEHHAKDFVAPETSPIDIQAIETEPVQQPLAPSIPLAQLVPLRGLLRHATTPTECRLLLSAMLSQLGVPQHSELGEAEPGPEEKVAAWLLGGWNGPPGKGWDQEVGQATLVDAGPVIGTEGEMTPKVPASVVSEDTTAVTAAEKTTDREGEEEEFLSETASSVSVTRDAESPSFGVATSATRSFPVHLAPPGA